MAERRTHAHLRGSADRQRGLALVTAMLVVALVATIAASLSLGQQVWLRQVQNITERAQAEAMRRGAFNFAALLLAKEARTSTVDHLGEEWAQPLPPLPFEGGTLLMTVADAQAQFNINNLYRNNAPSAADIGVLQRLLTANDLSPALTDAVIDWIDADSQLRPGGAEDIDYLAMPQPYRAANISLVSVDELHMIRGFTPEAVAKLRPYVAALPVGTELNINTVSAPVLSAMFANLPLSAAETIIETRARQPFTDPAQLRTLLPSGTEPPQVGYAVRTSYFLVTADVRIGRLLYRSQALLRRPPDGKSATVLWERAPQIPIVEDDTRL